MGKNTQFTEYGTVMDSNGVIHETKTTVLFDGRYVPYCYMTRENIAAWFESTDSPTDKVKSFLFRNTGRNNLFCYSEEEIAEKTCVGIATVKRTLSALESRDIIRFVGHGKWFVNPDNFYFGKAAKRDELLLQYYNIEHRKKGRGRA